MLLNKLFVGENMFEEVNKVVSEFVINPNNRIYIDNLEEVSRISESVYTQKEQKVGTDKWSKKIDINKSIEYVYEFICSIDSSMANQFMNLIHYQGEKIVDLLPRKGHEDEFIYQDRVDMNGIVHIYYEESPNDMFVIFHEMLHKMNEANIEKDGGRISENQTRNYFGEATSIIGEMLLGKWLVTKGIITENDFNIRMKKRLMSSKENARDVLIEAELIKLKLVGHDINEKNLLNSLKNTKNPVLLQIFSDESHDLRRMHCIKKMNDLNLRRSQRYVIGQYLADDFSRRKNSVEDFLKLNYEVGNVNADINKVASGLRSSSRK